MASQRPSCLAGLRPGASGRGATAGPRGSSRGRTPGPTQPPKRQNSERGCAGRTSRGGMACTVPRSTSGAGPGDGGAVRRDKSELGPVLTNRLANLLRAGPIRTGKHRGRVPNSGLAACADRTTPTGGTPLGARPGLPNGPPCHACAACSTTGQMSGLYRRPRPATRPRTPCTRRGRSPRKAAHM